jgi:multiple sugar transport system permease protein
MIFCAFQETSSDVYSYPPNIPNFLNFNNFKFYLVETEFLNQLGNTLLLVVSNMVIGLVASILVAYGFARFRAKGKKVAFTLLLSTMMLPWVVTMVPAYMLFAKLNMIGTFWPLILPSIGGSAFNIFLLRQFFMSLPRDLDEAAKIDGCNSFQVLTKILLPNCGPIIATIVIFSFIGTWSDYVGPSIYILDESHFTLSLGLQFLKSSNFIAPPWHQLMAACVIYALPMVIVYICCQKAFVRGAVGSAIK